MNVYTVFDLISGLSAYVILGVARRAYKVALESIGHVNVTVEEVSRRTYAHSNQ